MVPTPAVSAPPARAARTSTTSAAQLLVRAYNDAAAAAVAAAATNTGDIPSEWTPAPNSRRQPRRSADPVTAPPPKAPPLLDPTRVRVSGPDSAVVTLPDGWLCDSSARILAHVLVHVVAPHHALLHGLRARHAKRMREDSLAALIAACAVAGRGVLELDLSYADLARSPICQTQYITAIDLSPWASLVQNARARALDRPDRPAPEHASSCAYSSTGPFESIAYAPPPPAEFGLKGLSIDGVKVYELRVDGLEHVLRELCWLSARATALSNLTVLLDALTMLPNLQALWLDGICPVGSKTELANLYDVMNPPFSMQGVPGGPTMRYFLARAGSNRSIDDVPPHLVRRHRCHQLYLARPVNSTTRADSTLDTKSNDDARQWARDTLPHTIAPALQAPHSEHDRSAPVLSALNTAPLRGLGPSREPDAPQGRRMNLDEVAHMAQHAVQSYQAMQSATAASATGAVYASHDRMPGHTFANIGTTLPQAALNSNMVTSLNPNRGSHSAQLSAGASSLHQEPDGEHERGTIRVDESARSQTGGDSGGSVDLADVRQGADEQEAEGEQHGAGGTSSDAFADGEHSSAAAGSTDEHASANADVAAIANVAAIALDDGDDTEGAGNGAPNLNHLLGGDIARMFGTPGYSMKGFRPSPVSTMIDYRSLCIARLPKLHLLDDSIIHPSERVDAVRDISARYEYHVSAGSESSTDDESLFRMLQAREIGRASRKRPRASRSFGYVRPSMARRFASSTRGLPSSSSPSNEHVAGQSGGAAPLGHPQAHRAMAYNPTQSPPVRIPDSPPAARALAKRPREPSTIASSPSSPPYHRAAFQTRSHETVGAHAVGEAAGTRRMAENEPRSSRGWSLSGLSELTRLGDPSTRFTSIRPGRRSDPLRPAGTSGTAAACSTGHLSASFSAEEFSRKATRALLRQSRRPSVGFLCDPRDRPRQFEYNPSVPGQLVYGTHHGTLVVMNYGSGEVVGACQSGGGSPRHAPSPFPPQAPTYHVNSPGEFSLGIRSIRDAFSWTSHQSEGFDVEGHDLVLGLSWLNKQPGKFLGGTEGGHVHIYDVDWMRSGVNGGCARACENFPLLTSIHANSEDTRFVVSGYSNNVGIYDLSTGARVETMHDCHNEHINVLKFAHHNPNILVTSSFDKTIKKWDMRESRPNGVRRPIFTRHSKAGNVMVCFSPDDRYLLVSAVDNEVSQYVAADGRLERQFDIERREERGNYTRSYYMNGRDYIITGSCREDVIRIYNARDGCMVKEIDIDVARSGRMFVQSLRANPHENFNLSALVACEYLGEPGARVGKFEVLTSFDLLGQSSFSTTAGDVGSTFL